MDAVKFIEERNRMCKSFDAGCNGCPAFNACEDDLCCAISVMSTLDTTAQIAIVEKWSAAHPRKTRQSVFLEQYPRANLLGNGVITICPKAIEKGYAPSAGCNDTNCFDCKTKYWMQEVEV